MVLWKDRGSRQVKKWTSTISLYRSSRADTRLQPDIGVIRYHSHDSEFMKPTVLGKPFGLRSPGATNYNRRYKPDLFNPGLGVC